MLRFLTLARVLRALMIGAIAPLKNLGWLTTDWVALERHAKENLAAA